MLMWRQWIGASLQGFLRVAFDGFRCSVWAYFGRGETLRPSMLRGIPDEKDKSNGIAGLQAEDSQVGVTRESAHGQTPLADDGG